MRARRLPLFEFAAEAFIPEGYVTSESQKITLYKRIAGLQSEEEVDEMFKEIDIDKDGNIRYQQFIQVMLSK